MVVLTLVVARNAQSLSAQMTDIANRPLNLEELLPFGLSLKFPGGSVTTAGPGSSITRTLTFDETPEYRLNFQTPEARTSLVRNLYIGRLQLLGTPGVMQSNAITPP